MKTQTPLLAAFVGCALLASAGALFAQNPDLPYSSGSTGADGPLNFTAGPSGRTNAATAFDTTRNRLVMFGGTTSAGTSNETWEWDGTSWTPKAPAASPPPRYNHSMAYDAARGKVLVFGGHATNGSALNDTWEWDGTNWAQKSPATSPSTRESATMAYDSTRQRVVLFGGYYYLSDTWEWDGTNWAEKTSATVPPARWDHAMAYDATRQKIVMHGGIGNASSSTDTWEWDGTLWVQKILAPAPSARYDHTMAYDANRQKIVLFGGYTPTYLGDTWEYNGTAWTQIQPPASPPARSAHSMAYDATRQRVVVVSGASVLANLSDDTWEYNGTVWVQKQGSDFFFDMTGRANGIWNFTTITIPAGIRVRFARNATNTPVTWLAAGAVQIDGELNLDGSTPVTGNSPGTQGKGGPGGFDGGLGGTRFNASGSFAGTPGQGPGGGAAGTTSGQQGANGNGNYGNAYLQPLVGGSGGGGGGSGDTNDGGNGGGGGGAILIASSLDITVSGNVHALGGNSSYGGASYGGNGSGGSIRLVADRVSGSGTVNGGRLRFEGYFRSLLQGGTITGSVGTTSSSPIATAAPGAQPALAVTSVAGQPVSQPPSGNPASPDVIFSTAGTINIVVTASNIPDGTAVTCRVTSGSQVITLPAAGYPNVTLAGGTATFSTTVQPGIGSVQAFASFTTP